MNSDAVKNIVKVSSVALLVTAGAIGAIVVGIGKSEGGVPVSTTIAEDVQSDVITQETTAGGVDDGVSAETTTTSDNSQNTETAETTTSAVTTVANAPAGVMSISANASNSWENGGMIYTQVDFVITNNANSVSDWTVLMPIPANSRIDQSWNGVYTVEGANMRIRPDGTNANINSGSSINFGCIIASPEPLNNPSPSLM